MEKTDIDSIKKKAADLRAEADRLAAEAKQAERDAKAAERRRIREEEDKRIEAAKVRVFQETGTTDNPKREQLWSKAWELGHSAGVSEVEYYYCDLVELIK